MLFRSPTTKLHVAGTTTTDSLVLKRQLGLIAPTSIAGWNYSGGNMDFTGGNVGIGTTSPGANLDIIGQEATGGDSLRMTGNIALGGYDLTGYANQRGALKSKLFDGTGIHKGYLRFATPGGNGPGIYLQDTSATNSSLDRKSVVEGKSVCACVALGGRRIITKKIKKDLG